MTVAAHEYPPFYGRTGKGLLVDLYRAAFEAVNLEVKFQVYPIGRAIQYFKLGKIDAVSPGELILPSIDKSSILSVNVFNVTMCWVYYAPKFSGKAPPNLENIRNYNLSVINFSPYIQAYREQKLKFMRVGTPRQLMRLLKSDRVQLSEVVYLSSLWASVHDFPDEQGAFKCIPRTTEAVGLAFYSEISRAASLARLFRQGINRIKGSGEYIEILESYWGEKNIPRELLPADIPEIVTRGFSEDVFYSKRRGSSGKILN